MSLESKSRTDNSPNHLNGPTIILLGKLLSFIFSSQPNETSLLLQHRRAAQRRCRAPLFAQVWDDIPPKYVRHII